MRWRRCGWFIGMVFYWLVNLNLRSLICLRGRCVWSWIMMGLFWMWMRMMLRRLMFFFVIVWRIWFYWCILMSLVFCIFCVSVMVLVCCICMLVLVCWFLVFVGFLLCILRRWCICLRVVGGRIWYFIFM